MNFSKRVTPTTHLKNHAADIGETLAVTQNGEAKLALLKVLALGNREIEQGRFRSASDVMADLDQEDAQWRSCLCSPPEPT